LVKFTLELAGDVSSFTPSVQAQIQVVIAALAGVNPSAVDVTISPGSVIIDVRIQTHAGTAALVQSTMASATSSPSSATLMLANVTGVSITVLAVVTPPVVANISPPPPPSPSPPSSTDEVAASAVETSGSMGIIIGAVVGVIAVVGACMGAVAIVLRRKRSRRPKHKRGSVQDPSPGIVIEPMASRTASRTKRTLLPEALDRVLLKTRVRRLRPMLRPGQGQSWILHSPGVLRGPSSDCEMRITAGRLYLEQKDASDGADSSGTLEQWPLAALTSVRRRRHELRHTALELLMAASQSGHQSGGAQGSVVLEFHSHEEREQVVRTLVGQKPHLRLRDEQLPEMTEKWHAREIDNYTYLLHLNDCASRSFDDLSQYPIMPWVLSDYSSDALDLNDPRRYRPLWKPVGALDERRLAATHRQRHELQVDAEAGQTIPLYRTHYSSPAYVAYYLLRIFPEITIHIQSGEFDHEARSFSSVDRTWLNVSERATGDVKELIPQFYSDPAFLRKERGVALPPWCEDVVLPPWAGGSYTEFVRQMRAALESDFVSAHLHLWIDLIFGSKQQGAPALKANNLFEGYTYESALESGELDNAARKLIRSCVTDFGQTPPQLFAQAHPPRRLRVNGLPQPWRAAEPSATLIQANARRWLGRRHIVATAVDFFFDEKAFRGTAALSIEVPPVDVVLRTDYTDGFSFAYSKRTRDWMLALGAAAEAASDEQDIGMFLESCFRSDDERRYAPSECHPFANALREYCGFVSQLFAQNGRSPASRMSAAVRLKNLSKAVQLGLKRMHAIVVRVLPPLQEPRRSALVRALVLDEITTRLSRPLIMPLIQSVHGADDAAYADSVGRFAQLRPHHLEGIVNLPPHFWLGSSDADASSHVPYATAIKALSHLSATYSTRRKLALLMDVLQAIQHHVWSYHGIASQKDQANDMRLRLAADDLISVVAYVLSQARPVLHLGSELAFIERFADDGCLLGEHGYCLATVQAASGFLRTLTWPQIELGLQNAALRKGAEAAAAAAAAAAVPHNAQPLHGDTGAAVAASIADASSSGSNTPKPPRPLGPRYSGIVEQIRARKANGGTPAGSSSESNAPKPPRTLGPRYSEIAEQIRARKANGGTPAGSSSESNAPKPPRPLGPRYSEVAEQIRARKANGGPTADAAMNADNTMRRIRREQRRVVGDPLGDPSGDRI
jgi:hypothetical protein